jgi:hypothetical protein
LTWRAGTSSLLLLVLSAASAPQDVAAQVITDPTMQPQGFGLTKDDFEVTFWRDRNESLTRNEAELFFNRAHCECETQVLIRIVLKPTGRTKVAMASATTTPVRVLAGFECSNSNIEVRRACEPPLGGTSDVSSLVNNPLWIETNVRRLFSAKRAEATIDEASVCERETQPSIWLSLESPSKAPEIVDTGAAVPGDGLEPVPPMDLRVTSGHEALEVKWRAPETVTDLEGFIVFCSRGENLAVFPGAFEPTYSTTAVLCGTPAAAAPAAGALGLAAGAADTGEPGPAPPQLRTLVPEFACSDLLTKTETSHRLRTLQNGIPYLVGVASVDKHGNASTLDLVVLQTPIPTRDFYRGYRAEGGAAEGGFCSLARGRGQARATDLLWLLAPLALAWRRRRR